MVLLFLIIDKYKYIFRGYENDDNSEESLQDILNKNSVLCSIVTKNEDAVTKKEDVVTKKEDVTVIKKIDVIEPISDIKMESPELDEEFHDALFSEEEDTIKKENTEIKIKESILKNSIKAVYEMTIYFNKNCYSGTRTVKKKISNLPMSIGPGPVSKILHKAIILFINLDFSPRDALKKIKKSQHMLFDGPGGVEILISAG